MARGMNTRSNMVKEKEKDGGAVPAGTRAGKGDVFFGRLREAWEWQDVYMFATKES